MSTPTVKRLPYGISNFEDIVAKNYAYVDKTRFIALLEDESNPYQFFIRPRKFGKSLFCSILACYYNVNKADKFAQLFGNLYIGKNPTPEKNACAIMPFNFSGINTTSEDDFKASFSGTVQLAASLTVTATFSQMPTRCWRKLKSKIWALSRCALPTTPRSRQECAQPYLGGISTECRFGVVYTPSRRDGI
jgi:hypothetical protein